MSTFKQLKCNNDLNDIIKSIFDTDLQLSGDWGYTQDTATIINISNVPLNQLQHMIAFMRTYTEMNMTLAKKDRYGSINLNEIEREQILANHLIYDKVTYHITAMKEDVYATFIKAYKDGYGKDDFNMSEHFNKRKKATQERTEVFWFEIHQTL